jgi:2-polyprenyl-3-methyl-5-hydroxy-6-metoxy-1,4-benzoquinol methylase
MKRSYWEKIAPSYNEEIFDVLENDEKALIRSAIKKYAAPHKIVIDIGCAIGKWIPVVSPLFKKVYALDISEKNLHIARLLHFQYKNVEYIRADMSGKKNTVPKADVAICINAILSSSLKDRTVFFESLPRCVKRGGHLLLVVPSLESYLLTNIIGHQWKIDRAILDKKIHSKTALKKWKNIRQGNADIDNVPTKHYLREELSLLLNQQGFECLEFEKIEYSWETEFNRPPKWLKEPKPWDWLAIARKK